MTMINRQRDGEGQTFSEVPYIDELRLWSNMTGISIESLARNNNLKLVQKQANLISLKQQQRAERVRDTVDGMSVERTPPSSVLAGTIEAIRGQDFLRQFNEPTEALGVQGNWGASLAGRAEEADGVEPDRTVSSVSANAIEVIKGQNLLARTGEVVNEAREEQRSWRNSIRNRVAGNGGYNRLDSQKDGAQQISKWFDTNTMPYSIAQSPFSTEMLSQPDVQNEKILVAYGGTGNFALDAIYEEKKQYKASLALFNGDQNKAIIYTEALNKAQGIGAVNSIKGAVTGTIDAIFHPIDTANGIIDLVTNPKKHYNSVSISVKEWMNAYEHALKVDPRLAGEMQGLFEGAVGANVGMLMLTGPAAKSFQSAVTGMNLAKKFQHLKIINTFDTVKRESHIYIAEAKRLKFDPAQGKITLAEASAAVELQSHYFLARLERSASRADFIVTNGAYKGKTVDFMFTTSNATERQVMKQNEYFVRNWSKPFDNTPSQILYHLEKADIVPMDLRLLNAANREILLDYVVKLPLDARKRIIIIK